MNRTVVVVLVLAVLFSGATATAAAFTGGDEVAPGSEVYLDAAATDNGDKYVRFDASDEIRLQFDTLPPGSQTRVDDLFVVGFAGYEDSDDATTVRLESTDDRVAIERMDTGESFGGGAIELGPGESVLFGAVVSTDAQRFSSTIELEVDVPRTDTGSGSSSSDGATDDVEDVDGADADDPDDDGETPPEETTGDDEGVGTDDDGTAAGEDATDPGADTDADSGIDLIELAGFGTPGSLAGVSLLAALLSLSYVYRLRLTVGDPAENAGGAE